MKYMLLFICLLMVGCGQTEKVKVTIIKVDKIECGGEWLCGCIGEDYNTVIKTVDGRVDRVCAYIGEMGDVVTGYWTSGHFDPIMNGFRLNK